MADAGGASPPPAAAEASGEAAAPRFQGDLTKVRVVLRLRPLLRREYGYPLAAERLSDTRLRLFAPRAEVLSEADAVLDETSTQEEVFATVADVVAGALRGCNGTIFAYGQTGTGKTYTMLGRETPPKVAGGPPGYALSGAARGIIPRAVEALLSGCEALRTEGWTASLSAVYLQQYGERLFDLRRPLPSAAQPWARDSAATKALAGLELRPEPGGGVAAAGAEVAALTCLDDVAELLRAGAQHRALRATELNDASSRSHAILQVVLEATRGADAPGGARYRRAKLNLVDLAGSEKWAPGETSLAPERVAELCAINASLAALGACVRALGTGAGHVPARDSKLTRLLADALGGGALTALVATVSPSALSYDESASTLRFADAAGKVQVTARPAGGGGGDDDGSEGDAAAAAAAARAEVARLTALLRSLTGDDDGAKAALEADNARLRRELAEAKRAEKAAARRAADAARVAAAAGAEKAAAERAAAEAAAKRPAPPRRAGSVAAAPPQLQAHASWTPRVPGEQAEQEHHDDDDDAVLAALRPAPPPARLPSRLPLRDRSRGASSVASSDARLSAGWASDIDDADAAAAAAAAAAPAGPSGPMPASGSARGSGGSNGSGGGGSSAAWLAEYAEAKRAAAAATAAARAARADGGWRGTATSGVGKPAAAWEQAPFYSKRAPTPPAPLLGATSSSRSLRGSGSGDAPPAPASAAVPASTVRARGIYGGGSAAGGGVAALSASQRLAAAKARAGSAVTPPAARAAGGTPPARNAATPPAGRGAGGSGALAVPGRAKPAPAAVSPQRTRVRAASAAAPTAVQPRAAPAAPAAVAPPPQPEQPSEEDADVAVGEDDAEPPEPPAGVDDEAAVSQQQEELTQAEAALLEQPESSVIVAEAEAEAAEEAPAPPDE